MAENPENKRRENVILVAEDDEAIQELIRLALDERPYHVHVVAYGHEALRVIEHVTPQLLLLDYQMPSMTGLQLYDRLHLIPRLQNVPTIIMSANLPVPELERRGIIGLQKPFSLDDLQAAIDRALQMAQMRRERPGGSAQER